MDLQATATAAVDSLGTLPHSSPREVALLRLRVEDAITKAWDLGGPSHGFVETLVLAEALPGEVARQVERITAGETAGV